MKRRSDSQFGVTLDELVGRLAAAANTSRLVAWDRLTVDLEKVEPLTERQHCEGLLELANGTPITGKRWNALVGAPVQVGADSRSFTLPAELRQWLVAQLEAIHSGKGRTIAPAITATASRRVVQAPVWQVTPRGRIENRHRIVAQDITGALAFGLVLLLDPARDLGALLCRCRFTECGKFFMTTRRSSRGRMRRLYCCADHVEAGMREEATRRMQRWRKSRRQR